MNALTIKKALNKTFLKATPNRTEIDHFKKELRQLLQTIDSSKYEEFNKNVLADFLKNSAFAPKHFINTKGRNDLVVHHDKKAKSPVGVIIETKRPDNTSEMPTKTKLNAKAVQELVLYYLRERITEKNDKIKNLIVTDAQHWFIFDEQEFFKHFANDKKLVKTFEEFERGAASSKNTDYFYKNIAAPAIEKAQETITFTYFDIRDYKKIAFAENSELDKKLIPLLKICSPEHWLKLPFANDSNSLDKKFYNELLHIIGLEEVGKSKKTIQRLTEGKRNNGSLLENAIEKLDSTNKVRRLPKVQRFGKTYTEQLEAVALELVITWINRILFLKLLEAQLITYHNGDKAYAFLNTDKLQDFDEVEVLFFEVLAKRVQDRSDFNNQAFGNVPYLNSSLFEPTELENATVEISGLRDRFTLPLHTASVLKDDSGKKRTGDQNTLEYLLAFLDAYDFGSETSEKIQEKSKTIINASVLGLIFEKINGYKDGSFFTPGFITMYMCRETLRRAVLQKFNDAKGWNCQDFEDLKGEISDWKREIGKKQAQNAANDIFKTLRICDPAVGSGHFLVSALNELICIKYDLRILQDKNGNTLHDISISVENDELQVTDEERDDDFKYRPNSKASQNIQETIFREKQIIIENCLFGVDINPNSVKICRLRLWIELLKNAYYKANNELETLPNIDINIKCGNSLISRFALDEDLKKALKKHKYTIPKYRKAVSDYRTAENKEQKWEMQSLIETIKKDFRTSISLNSKERKRLAKLGEELYYKYNSTSLFDAKLTAKQKKDKAALETKVAKLKTQIEDAENNKIYENAFEWRFEFPEVLDDEGNFVGFDVVIGNPPYVQLQSIKEMSKAYKTLGYQTFQSTGDLYTLFYERGETILKTAGLLGFITGSAWMRANYGKKLRQFFVEKVAVKELIDFSDCDIFDSATVLTNILLFEKTDKEQPVKAIRFTKKDQDRLEHLEYIFKNEYIEIDNFSEHSWVISNKQTFFIKRKIEEQGVRLKDWDIEINRGILTGFNAAFIINKEKRDELIQQDSKSAEVIKPILRGRDVQKYVADFKELWIVGTFPSLSLNIDDYPAIKNYLASFGKRLEQSGEKGSRKRTSNKWFETQDNIAYWQNFEKPKINYPNMTKFLPFAIDLDNQFYHNDKAFHLITDRLYWLVSFLNSKLFRFCFAENFPELQGNSKEVRKVIFEQIPVKQISETEEQPFKEKVTQILELKKADAAADTSALEQEIDELVYALYELTAEEIAIVNGTA
jgi:type II restriction/modification system DNA methylase subunit YeeA